MALKKRFWLLAVLTLIFLGMLIRHRRAPAAIAEPPSVPALPPPPPAAPPVPVPTKAPAKPAVVAPVPPQPEKERGAGLKEKGESLFGGAD